MKSVLPSAFIRASAMCCAVTVAAFGNPPPHEPAYVNGHTVIISIKDPAPGAIARQA